MAHFAEINHEGIVQRVIVVANEDLRDSDGNEVESIGVDWLRKKFGVTAMRVVFGEDPIEFRWIQTSYNANLRFRFAGKGHYFDESRDAFIPPQPYPSWGLDELSLDWESPVPYPDDDEIYSWDEANLQWVKRESGGG